MRLSDHLWVTSNDATELSFSPPLGVLGLGYRSLVHNCGSALVFDCLSAAGRPWCASTPSTAVRHLGGTDRQYPRELLC